MNTESEGRVGLAKSARQVSMAASLAACRRPATVTPFSSPDALIGIIDLAGHDRKQPSTRPRSPLPGVKKWTED
ncbi:hypothetical protein [Streptomyces cinereospinus]|uniref:Uncharacterized protein n=1 Tax=Streptomyces cinereospinus TaxID=285561 RepID=A0ABV5N8R8_9ACTN